MRVRSQFVIRALAALAVIASGCDDDPSTTGTEDADASPPVQRDALVDDARIPVDQGPPIDARVPNDARPPRDAAPPTCDDGDTRACDDPTCPAGEQTCADGQWSDCVGPAETCNGADDDCDGDIDEDFALGAPCSAGVGECQANGVIVCNADGTDVVCGAVPGDAEPERCDRLDNDCDGAVDNECRCDDDGQCPPAQECIEGVCIGRPPPCEGVECPPGQLCEEGVCVDAPDPCAGVACAPGERCQDGVCVLAPQPCDGDDQCPPGQLCDGGVCVAPDPCAGVQCPVGERCLDGACVPAVDPCMDVECAPDERCVDGVCVAAPPPCVEDADCPDGERCAAGECVPVVPPCIGDDDCAPDEFCNHGECMFRGLPCRQDAQCPEGERCVEGYCANAACNDDLFEDNDDLETATELLPGAPTGAIVCADDTDYFSIVVPDNAAGCMLRAHIEFVHARGDIDARLLDGNGNGIAAGLSTTDNEDLDIELLGGGTFYYEVTLFGGGSNGYTLTALIDCSDRLICPEDDPFEDNDALAQAQPVDSGSTTRAIVCGADVDFYSIEAGDGDTLNIDLLFRHEEGDLNLRLLGADGEQRAASASVTDDEDIQFVVAAAGTYYLEVALAEGGVKATYDLRVRVARTVHCPADDDGFEENDDAASAAPLPLAQANDAVACPEDDDYYAFEVGPGCRVFIDVRFSHADGDIDIRLIDENGERVAQSLGVSDNESLDTIPGPAGTYVLLVNLFGGDGNRYSVQVDVRDCPGVDLVCPDDDQFEQNDDLGSATPLDDGQSLAAIACGADRDYYVVEARAGCTLTADLTFTHADGDLNLRLLNGDGENLQSSAGGEDNERIAFPVEADAPLYLWVEHLGGGGNIYELEVDQVDCPQPGLVCPDDDPFEDNDDIENAAPLAAGQAVAGIVCGGDRDYFAVEVGAGCTVSADLDFTHANGDLDLRLVDAQGGELDTSDGVGDQEHVEARLAAGGTVFVGVFLLGEGGNPYALTVGVDCAPPALTCPEDDGFEENDLRGSATGLLPGEPRDAIVCGGDLDFYVIAAGPGCTITAAVGFRHADGDIDLRLQDAAGEELAASLGVEDDEALRYVVESAGNYYLRVNLADEGGNPYRIEANVVSCPPVEDLCPPDDAREPDGDRDTATALADGESVDGIACGADRDLFAVEVGAGCTLTADLTFLHMFGDLDLRLLDADGETIAQSLTVTNRERIERVIANADTYYLQVGLVGEGGNRYGLALDLVCPGPGLQCPADDAFEENDDLATAAPLVPGVTVEGIVCGDDVDLFALPVEAGCQVRAGLEFTHADGDLDLHLIGPDGAELAAGVSVTDDETAEIITFVAGEYFVGVELFGGESNLYALTVDVVCEGILVCPLDDEFEENDDLPTATALEADTPADGIVCGDDVDYFAVEAPAGCTLRADVSFLHAGGDIDVQLFDVQSNSLASGVSVTDDEHVEAAIEADGRYFLEIGLLEGAGNRYTVRFTLDCPTGRLVINEVDYDQPGADEAEFVEIINAGEAPVDLTGMRLLLVNGANDEAYATYDLGVAGPSLAPGQLLVVGAAAVLVDLPEDVLRLELPANGLENGSPDGVQLVLRTDAGDEILDGMSYEGLMPGVSEGDASAPDDDGPNSLNRCPDGSDTDLNVDDFQLGAPTPGGMNDCDGPGRCPADDPLEENDDVDTATVLESGQTVQGVVCGGDLDFFAVTLPSADCSVSATLEFMHMDGDLDLRLVDVDGTPLANSASTTDDESILRQVATGGTYYLVVELAEGLENEYRLTATVFCPEGELVINEFDYDQPGFDTLEFVEILNVGFAPVALADVRLELIEGYALDAPYATFNLVDAAAELPAGGTLVIGTAGVLDRLPAGTPTIEIPQETIQNGSPDGMRLVRGEGDLRRVLDSLAYEGPEPVPGLTEGPERLTGDNDVFAWGRCPNGVDTNNNREDFDLLVPSPGRPNACILTCPEDDEFEPNNALIDARPLDRQSFQRGVVCGADADYFQVILNAGCQLEVALEFTHAAGNLDLRLQDEAGVDLVTSLSVTNNEAISYPAPADAAYYLRVNLAGGGESNQYAIAVDTVCP